MAPSRGRVLPRQLQSPVVNAINPRIGPRIANYAISSSLQTASLEASFDGFVPGRGDGAGTTGRLLRRPVYLGRMRSRNAPSMGSQVVHRGRAPGPVGDGLAGRSPGPRTRTDWRPMAVNDLQHQTASQAAAAKLGGISATRPRSGRESSSANRRLRIGGCWQPASLATYAGPGRGRSRSR
jgi:hypothetical protein